MDNLPLQSGGTDISSAIDHMNKHNPDLAIFVTDMHLSKSTVPIKHKSLIWVVSDPTGLANHPYKDVGKTILLSGVVGG
jgi:predicted metal-dependent peptidase